MKNILVPEVRPDKDGKLVTRHVKSGASVSPAGKPIPSPALTPDARQRKRRAFKPSAEQLMDCRYGAPINNFEEDENWGNHVILPPAPELEAIPFTREQQEAFQGSYYRFTANEVEYYSVLSAVRPFDALNLLHRGIRSADEAKAFLAEHGLDHLAGDYSHYTEELMRLRIRSNMALVYMNDIIDADADPQLAAEWVKLCDQKSIIDKAMVIKDEMLSGQVTANEMKSVGIRNLLPDIKGVAESLIHLKHDENPQFTVEDIAAIMENELDTMSYEKEKTWISSTKYDPVHNTRPNLSVMRYYGRRFVSAEGRSMYWHGHKQMKDTGKGIDDKRLADLTLYATEARTQLFFDEDYSLLEELFDSGMSAKDLYGFVAKSDKSMSTASVFAAAKAGIHSTVSNGWL